MWRYNDGYPQTTTAISINITFPVWARRNAIGDAEYASRISPKILNFFEDYFNISFPLPKQDTVALPDLPFGAMENWGLIIYRYYIVIEIKMPCFSSVPVRSYAYCI